MLLQELKAAAQVQTPASPSIQGDNGPTRASALYIVTENERVVHELLLYGAMRPFTGSWWCCARDSGKQSMQLEISQQGSSLLLADCSRAALQIQAMRLYAPWTLQMTAVLQIRIPCPACPGRLPIGSFFTRATQNTISCDPHIVCLACKPHLHCQLCNNGTECAMKAWAFHWAMSSAGALWPPMVQQARWIIYHGLLQLMVVHVGPIPVPYQGSKPIMGTWSASETLYPSLYPILDILPIQAEVGAGFDRQTIPVHSGACPKLLGFSSLFHAVPGAPSESIPGSSRKL